MTSVPRPVPRAAGPDEEIIAFESPPVAEVVSAVRFSELVDATVLSFGDLSAQKYVSFPNFELKPPYDVPREVFGPAGRQSPPVEFNLSSMPPLPRVWMTDSTGHELVQIQRDWFAVNWRKVGPASEYGRWPARRQAFQRNYLELEHWLVQRGESLAVAHCEVTYINHIEPMPDVWSTHADAHAVFRTFPAVEEAPYELEEVHWQARFLITSASGEPCGRLHVLAQPVFRIADSHR